MAVVLLRAAREGSLLQLKKKAVTWFFSCWSHLSGLHPSLSPLPRSSYYSLLLPLKGNANAATQLYLLSFSTPTVANFFLLVKVEHNTFLPSLNIRFFSIWDFRFSISRAFEMLQYYPVLSSRIVVGYNSASFTSKARKLCSSSWDTHKKELGYKSLDTCKIT